MDSSSNLVGIRFFCTTCGEVIDHERVHKGRSGWFHLKYGAPKCGGCPPKATPHIVERQEIVGQLRVSAHEQETR